MRGRGSEERGAGVEARGFSEDASGCWKAACRALEVVSADVFGSSLPATLA